MSKSLRTKELDEACAVGTEKSLIDALTGISPDGKAYIKGLLNYAGASTWHGTKVVPPGSFLEDVVELFRCQTDIPLELPLIAVLSHVSGFLNASRAQYEMGGALHAPRLWTIALAPSGSGKTFATTTVGRWLSDAEGKSAVPQLSNASSAAQFVANVEQCPRGLWFRDELRSGAAPTRAHGVCFDRPHAIRSPGAGPETPKGQREQGLIGEPMLTGLDCRSFEDRQRERRLLQ